MVPSSLVLPLLAATASSYAQQCRLVLNSNSASGQPGSTASGSAPATDNSTATNTSHPFQPFTYGSDIIRGVNLGGWFVMEPWITPSIFNGTGNPNIVDEFTFGQMQDNGHALSVLQNHWNTWINESDFEAIAAAGLNHVRIPVGYWSVPMRSADTQYSTDVSPYIPGAWPYLLKALNWARANGIHVILDLHGAPGSQNGFDNSGQRTGNPQWTNGTNVNRTLDIITFIAKNIGGMVDVIELLNEPAGFMSQDFADTVRGYWQAGYDAVRAAVGGGVKIMIGDAFLGVQSWTDFLTYPSMAQGVLMDYHEYQIFSVPELQRTLDEHIQFACTLSPNLSSFAAHNLYTINGEWSTAATDCALWLNGRGVGARWDGTYFNQNQPLGSCNGWTGSMDTFSDGYKTFLRKYWEAQVEIAEKIQGWIFWTWKAENADEWSYQKGLEGGWIPQDPTDRKYPGMCPNTTG